MRTETVEAERPKPSTEALCVGGRIQLYVGPTSLKLRRVSAKAEMKRLNSNGSVQCQIGPDNIGTGWQLEVDSNIHPREMIASPDVKIGNRQNSAYSLLRKAKLKPSHDVRF